MALLDIETAARVDSEAGQDPRPPDDVTKLGRAIALLAHNVPRHGNWPG